VTNPSKSREKGPHQTGPSDRQTTIDPLLTGAEVCGLLRIKQTKLYELTARGDLRSIRMGARSIRYRMTDVQSFIESNESMT